MTSKEAQLRDLFLVLRSVSDHKQSALENVSHAFAICSDSQKSVCLVNDGGFESENLEVGFDLNCLKALPLF